MSLPIFTYAKWERIPDKPASGGQAGMTKWMKDSGAILDEARTRARMTFSGQYYALPSLLGFMNNVH